MWGRHDPRVMGALSMSLGMAVDPCLPPPPCNVPSTPAPTYTPRHPKDNKEEEEQNPTHMVPPTSYWSPAQSRAKPASPAREGRGASAGSRQAGRQQDREGAGHSTFHPDMELAQLALQLILQETHVLGTDRRMDRTHEQPPMDSASCQPIPAGCLTSVYSL